MLLAALWLTWTVRPRKSYEEPEESGPLPWLPDHSSPKVSFLVAAWNAGASTQRFIRSYERLTYPNKELILCAGGSDGTFEAAGAVLSPAGQVIRQLPSDGKQGALRRSLELATGDIIYLTDIDCEPDDECVNTLVGFLARRGVEVATGSMRPLDEQLSSQFVAVQYATGLATTPRTPGAGSGMLGCNSAIGAGTLRKSGALARSVQSGTDYHLAQKLLETGASIWVVPQSAMPTAYSTTWREHVARQARWLRNLIVLGTRFGQWGDVRAAATTVCLGYALLLGYISLLASIVRRPSRPERVWRNQVPRLSVISCIISIIAISNRMRVMADTGAGVNRVRAAAAAAKHFFAAQCAALACGLHLVTGDLRW